MSASWGFAGSDAFAPLFSPFEPVASSPSSLGVIDKLARLFPASMGRRRQLDSDMALQAPAGAAHIL